jgi:hypothetical protein
LVVMVRGSMPLALTQTGSFRGWTLPAAELVAGAANWYFWWADADTTTSRYLPENFGFET